MNTAVPPQARRVRPGLTAVAALLASLLLHAPASGQYRDWRDSVQPGLLAVSVGDLDAAVDWYGQALGFVQQRTGEVPEMGLRMAVLALGDFQVELVELEGARDRTPLLPDPTNDASLRGFGKMTMLVADLDAVLTRMESAGVPPLVSPGGGDGPRWFMVRDPEGNLWQFVEVPGG